MTRDIDTPSRETNFSGLPDVHLELPGANVLDGRIVTLGYRPANPPTESGR
jgi:hypothetical protein